MLKLAIMISGRGSNMAAIIEAIKDGRLNAEIVGVLSNKKDAKGLEIARSAGLKTADFNITSFTDKDAYETAVVKQLQAWNTDWIALAGYMRIIGTPLLKGYKDRIINIHPSLLPDFKGLNAQAQALKAGVKQAGCTVHLVDESLDGGPILKQATVPVLSTDTVDTLSARILKEEHRIYSETLAEIASSKH